MGSMIPLEYSPYRIKLKLLVRESLLQQDRPDVGQKELGDSPIAQSLVLKWASCRGR